MGETWEVPKTFRAWKAIRKTAIRLFCKVGLFICCKGPWLWRYYVTRNAPEKCRDFRETGPWPHHIQTPLATAINSLAISPKPVHWQSHPNQTINDWNEAWTQRQELHALLFANSVWDVLRLTGLWTLKGCETGRAVYLSLSEKTKKSNHLQMSSQRQLFLLSYFKTQGFDPATSHMVVRYSTNWAHPFHLKTQNAEFTFQVFVQTYSYLWKIWVGKMPYKIAFYHQHTDSWCGRSWKNSNLHLFKTASNCCQFCKNYFLDSKFCV